MNRGSLVYNLLFSQLKFVKPLIMKFAAVLILVIGVAVVSEAGLVKREEEKRDGGWLNWGLGNIRDIGNGLLNKAAGDLGKLGALGLPGTGLAIGLVDKARNAGNRVGGVLGVDPALGPNGPEPPIVNPLEPTPVD